jgi:cytochrome c biogenesis protein CcmG/thiol:disulfide interchange protein DsbE
MQAEEQPSVGISPGEIPPGQFTQGRKSRRSRRRLIIILVVSLINLALLVLLGSQLLVPAQNQSNAGSSPLIRHPAPDFTLAVLSAHAGTASKMHLADLKGKPIVLNFWASWCDPCKHEAPLLQATWRGAQSRGIIFLGIDFQDTRSDGLNFLQKYGITYLNVVDDTGSTAINYGVSGVPETFFLDRHGVIVSKVIGELTEQTLQSNLHLLAH